MRKLGPLVLSTVLFLVSIAGLVTVAGASARAEEYLPVLGQEITDPVKMYWAIYNSYGALKEADCVSNTFKRLAWDFSLLAATGNKITSISFSVTDQRELQIHTGTTAYGLSSWCPLR